MIFKSNHIRKIDTNWSRFPPRTCAFYEWWALRCLHNQKYNKKITIFISCRLSRKHKWDYLVLCRPSWAEKLKYVWTIMDLMDNVFDCIHSRLKVNFRSFDVPQSNLVLAPKQNPGWKKFAPYKSIIFGAHSQWIYIFLVYCKHFLNLMCMLVKLVLNLKV